MNVVSIRRYATVKSCQLLAIVAIKSIVFWAGVVGLTFAEIKDKLI